MASHKFFLSLHIGTSVLSLRKASTGLALSLLLTLPAMAQQYGVVRGIGGLLVAEPSFFSAIITPVPRGEKLEFLDRDGSFWKVRWNGREGWMSRAMIDKADAAADASAATVATASGAAPAQAAPVPMTGTTAAPVQAAPISVPTPMPAAPVAVAAAPAALAAPAPALAPVKASAPRGRAVVFGISQYRKDRNITTLLGVPRDMDSAAAMAELMGISPDRVSIYRDAELTKASMVAILTQLGKEVKEGEPVLIYYSGHGGRTVDPSAPGRCIEGLITHEAELLSSAEMSRLLQPLARATDSLFVFIDACHSGGLSATRAVTTEPQRFTAKFSSRGEVSNCSEIVNMLQAPPGTRATGNRFIYAAAARANEVSLDDVQQGGLATANFLRCMAQGPSASQTVEAIRACAQAGIERTLAGNTQFKPHNMTITGDLSIRPVRNDLSPALKQQLLSNASQGLLTNRPAAAKAAYVSNELATQGWPRVFNPQQAFSAITERSDSNAALAVEAPQTLKIDREALRMKVTAPADGFVYVFQATGDGKNAVMLFPNTSDRDHRVRAGQALDLPRPSWPLVAGGPEGENQLLVIFSKTERDLGQLVGQEAGPFLDLAVSPIGMQALTLAISRSAFADDAECKVNAPGRPAYCSTGYSASVKTIREVR